MTEASIRLVKANFLKDGAKDAMAEKAKELKQTKEEFIKGLNAKTAEEFANHHWMETSRDQMHMTDYPDPVASWYILFETPNESMETLYYDILQKMFDLGYGKVLKITDLYSASEHSSFWGSGAQRLGLQQDKVMTFLATIGKLVKDMFQLVREIRLIDERMDFYEGAKKKLEAAEITLKGIWVDLVDGVGPGGNRSNVNLWAMAQQLQFYSLPDFFFSCNPASSDDVDKKVDELGVNEGVKRVLKRKLYAYIRWKEQTHKELVSKRRFSIHYLRQHFQVIKMYMNWVKPYLKHIERLQGTTDNLDRPELVSAFESALIEVEILGLKTAQDTSALSCMLVNFEYRARPSMPFSVEYSHRGPLHVGETKITFRSYGWTEEQVRAYVAMKDREDLELLTTLDGSLKEAMQALGDDLDKYLKEAQGIKEEEKKEKTKQPFNLWEPFISVWKGLEELGSAFLPPNKKKSKDEGPTKDEVKGAGNVAKITTFLCYKFFKKGHGMTQW